MKKYIKIMLAIFLLSGCETGIDNPSAPTIETPKYRSIDCIIRFNIEWSEESKKEKEHMIRKLNEAISSAPTEIISSDGVSTAVQGEHRQFIFLQFKHNCENRLEKGQKLLEHITLTIENSQFIKLDKGSFFKGRDTIRVRGKWWLD